MPSLPNRCGRQSVTSGIAIKKARKTHGAFDRNNDEHDEISRSAEMMYDSATWRMYYRIINGRKRRAQVAIAHDAHSKTSSRLTKTKENNDSFFIKSSLKTFKRTERLRSLSSCSIDYVDSLRERRDEGIFELEL